MFQRTGHSSSGERRKVIPVFGKFQSLSKADVRNNVCFENLEGFWDYKVEFIQYTIETQRGQIFSGLNWQREQDYGKIPTVLKYEFW